VSTFMEEKTRQLNTVAAAKTSASSGGVNVNSVKGPTDNSSITNQTAVSVNDVSTDHSDSTSRDLLSQVS